MKRWNYLTAEDAKVRRVGNKRGFPLRPLRPLRLMILVLLLCGMAQGANDFTGDTACKALYRLETLNWSTEVDPGSTITCGVQSVTMADLQTLNTDSYVYVDYGAGYFSGDFTLKGVFKITGSSGTSAQIRFLLLANLIDDALGIDDAGGDYQTVLWYISAGVYYFGMEIVEDGSYRIDFSVAVLTDTNYYVTFSRDDDAGVNGTGQLTAEIHTTAYHPDGTHIDALTLDCSAGQQNDFRYLYPLDTYNSGFNNHKLSGSLQSITQNGTDVTIYGWIDSIGTNHFDDAGLTVDAVNYQEGSASIDDDGARWGICTDAALDSGFPFKSGDTGKKISVCCWFKRDANDAEGQEWLWSKWLQNVANQKSVRGGLYTDNAILCVGYNAGASEEDHTLVYEIKTGQWYHVGMTYNDSNRSYRIRLWDDTASTVQEATGTFDNNAYVGTADWVVGSYAPTDLYAWHGQIDELVVFNDILSAAEIDQIRGGTYTGPATGSGDVFHSPVFGGKVLP